MPERRQFLISCEHGGNQVPPRYQQLFFGQDGLLNSHRGYDPGTLQLGMALSQGLQAPLIKSEVTRLLVDLNRSLSSRSLHSDLLASLSDAEKEQILNLYYHPYCSQVERKARQLLDSGCQLVHLSVHSFTPELDGRIRNAAIGLLYDPSCQSETRFCNEWGRLLKARLPQLKIRYNYPYRGIADGLSRTLRREFKDQDYLGIELEVNQLLLNGTNRFPAELQVGLLETLQDLCPAD